MTNESDTFSSWAKAESRANVRLGWSPTERTQATSQLNMHPSSRYTGQPGSMTGSAATFQANSSTFQSNSDASAIWSQPPPRWNTTETGHSLRRAGTSPVPSRMNGMHGATDQAANLSNGNQSNFELGQQDVPFLGGRARNSLSSLGQTPAFRADARSNGIPDDALLRHYSTLSLSQEPGSFVETSSGGASRAGSVASASVPSGSAGLPNATAASPSSQRLSYATTAAPFAGHSQRSHLQAATAFSSPGAGASAVPYHHPNSLTENSAPSSTAASLQGPGGLFEGGLYGYSLPQTTGSSSSPSQLNPVSAAWSNANLQTNESANWMPKRAFTTGMQQQLQPPIAPFNYGQGGSYAQNGFSSQQQAQSGYNASNTSALLNRSQATQSAQAAQFEVPDHLSGYLRGDFDSQSIALRAAFSQSRHVSPSSFAAVPPASFMVPGQPAVASQYIQQQVLNGHNMFVPGALPSQHAGLSFGSPVYNASVTGSLRDRDPSRSMRGHLLKEFLESRGNRNFELLDIVGHVVEFSGDQHGSRFIQTKLETANKDTKDIIFGDLANNIVPLAMDVFGNYVIQKFLEHGSQKQKEYIAKQIRGRMIDLSTQTYSCRVVQRVMQSALLEQKVELARELDGHVLRVAKDASGNHVVLRIMSDVDRSELDFLVDAFRTKIVDLSAHIFGCRIVQNLYADGLDSDRDMIMAELKDHVQELSMGHYGNYVIQKIIKGRNPKHKALILNAVMAKLIPLCKEKHASNVVETCFISGSYEDRRRILQGIMKEDKPNVSIFYELMNDQFGNYVLRKLLGHLEGEDKALLAKHLTVQVDLCKKSGLVNPKTGIERIANALEALGDASKTASNTKDTDSPRTESSKLSSPDSKSASHDEATPPLTETPNSPDSSNPPSVRSGPLETDVAKSGETLPAIPAIAQPSDE